MRELSFNRADPGKVYNTLVMTAHLTQVISDNNDWARTVVNLMNQYPNIQQPKIGFIPGWQEPASMAIDDAKLVESIYDRYFDLILQSRSR